MVLVDHNYPFKLLELLKFIFSKWQKSFYWHSKRAEYWQVIKIEVRNPSLKMPRTWNLVTQIFNFEYFETKYLKIGHFSIFYTKLPKTFLNLMNAS